ncbi:601_t:CDS:2, partial [Racocetra fulgida]
YGGINVATKLELALHKTHQIILIERKTYTYHSIGGLRVAVEDGFEHKIMVTYKNLFKHGGKVVHATVTAIHEKEVIINNNTEWGTRIPFEYLVIATGSNHSKPAKMVANNKEEGVSEIVAQREAVKNANKILIIGGGPVGIELAGEIASVYSDKEITLVHSEDRLLSEQFPKKMTDLLAKQLRELNVNLIFGEKVILPSSGIGDAFGTKPNTQVVETLDESLIEEDTTLVK